LWPPGAVLTGEVKDEDDIANVKRDKYDQQLEGTKWRWKWCREYWMLYKGPGFLSVVWFGSFLHPLPPSPASSAGRALSLGSSLWRYCPARWIRLKVGSFDRSLWKESLRRLFRKIRPSPIDWEPFKAMTLGCPSKIVLIRNNRNWNCFGTIRNKTFVSVVSLLHRNSEFRCFDWTETSRRSTETNRNKQKWSKMGPKLDRIR
jgi:hypothetical protein